MGRCNSARRLTPTVSSQRARVVTTSTSYGMPVAETIDGDVWHALHNRATRPMIIVKKKVLFILSSLSV